MKKTSHCIRIRITSDDPLYQQSLPCCCWSVQNIPGQVPLVARSGYSVLSIVISFLRKLGAGARSGGILAWTHGSDDIDKIWNQTQSKTMERVTEKTFSCDVILYLVVVLLISTTVSGQFMNVNFDRT